MTLLLQGATVRGGERRDVRLDGERIAAVAEAGTLTPQADDEVLDLDGYVLLSAPAEPHAHLDKAYTAQRLGPAAPDLIAAIERWHDHRRGLSVEDLKQRARAAALETLSRGATAIRSHVDVGEGIGLRGAEALVGVREELRGLVDLQVVALAYPLAGEEWAENRRLLNDAIELGVDLVGGAAHVTDDPSGDLREALEVAERHGVGVDLHTDERLEPSDGLEELAQRCIDGFAGPATASHCVSLGMRSPEAQAQVAALVARAGVGVVTCPLTNLLLQGRGIRTATPRGLTAIAALMEAGVTLAAGGDNVQDVFNPIGCGDPLQTAQLMVAGGQLGVEDAYELVSGAARAVMGLEPVRLEAGSPAELLAVRASSVREAIATVTEARVVIHAGRVVARTTVQREPLWAADGSQPVIEEGAGHA
jgi:cytosine/creatinine deaminase